jgi:SAM-dependent methyltransferase
MLNLEKLTVGQIMRAQSLVKCNYFKHPYIADAPEEIARLQGRANFDELVCRYRYILKSPNCPTPLKENIIKLGFRPSNYQQIPSYYLGIETMLHLLEISKKSKAMLQLASNYGPFLFYLKRMSEFNKIYGIDVDRFAVQYGNQIGNKVLLASAHCLPIADSTFDIVFSQNFIDFEYFRFSNVKLATTMAESVSRIMNEIYRVLRSGGVFISSLEIFADIDDPKYWGPFDKRQVFAEQKSTPLSKICLFEKT